PLLVHEQLVAIEHFRHWHVALRDQSRHVHYAFEPEGDRLEVRRSDRGVARKEHRRSGEGMIARPGSSPASACGIPRPIQVQRNPDDFEIADDLTLSFLSDLVDETIHRLGDTRTIAA